jgi:hypothetical protein
MGIVEAVKKGFVDTGKLMNVVVIFFIFNLVVGLISLPLADPTNAGNPAVIAASLTLSIVFFFFFVFLQGGALGMVKDQIKTGTANVSGFMNYGKTYYLRILGLLLLYLLIAIGVVLILALTSAGLLLLGNNVVIRAIVATVVTVSALVIITFLLYPIYAVVADDLSPIPALRKGIAAAKNSFMKTLGLFMVMLVVSLVISVLVGFLAGVVSIPIGELVSRIILTVMNAIVQSYIPVVMMVAFMSFYMAVENKA